jgi:hypothetical protein
LNRYFSILVLFVLFPFAAQSQNYISGVKNSYYKVASFTNGQNYVNCDVAEDLSTLHPGDKVLLIQMTGARISTSGSWVNTNGQLQDFNNVGAYEFLSVGSIIGSRVYFTANLSRTYTTTEKIQLVKVYEADYATVTGGDVTATPWNGNKGGVIALVILKKLTLANNNISADGAGFRGASPEEYYLGCRPIYSPDTFYFVGTAESKGGRKGEGAIISSFNYPLGLGHALNGGGGGAGLFGGGGGGSNFYNGGNGGFQTKTCIDPDVNQLARGGYGFGSGFYSNVNNWVIMGGGGGSSSQNSFTVPPNYSAQDGGDGGGLIFILTDTIESNNRTISSNGSAASTATAGGSGGGAGGAILIDASAYSSIGNLYIDAKGGKGGNAGVSCGGGGGGGSAGVIWFSGASLPSNVTTNQTSGSGGTSPSALVCGSLNYGYTGTPGTANKITSLQPVLNGFLFNAVRESDTICEGQQPAKLIGTTPKGAGTFTYQWLTSYDNVTWSAIPSTNTKDYQPDTLHSTRYFTRKVTSGSGIVDVAIPVRIFVYPAISGNTITIRDTICAGNSPGLLHANTVSGGDGNYTYMWNYWSGTTWSTLGTTAEYNDTRTLFSSNFYQRIVKSAGGVCSSTSNTDTISVLPQITNNVFAVGDTTICYNLQAGVIKCTTLLAGGDGNYTYSWQVSSDNISYNTIALANGSTYNPGKITANRYYKRVVYSGSHNACVNTTSPAHVVTVLPSITNNVLTSTRNLYCYSENALAITSQAPGPGGGQSGSYSYQWLRSSGSNYSAISGATAQTYTPTPALTASVSYKRRIVSGADNACVDTSAAFNITVVGQIQNILETNDTAICNKSTPLPFSESPAAGGNGSFTYVWVQSYNSGSWANATGTYTNAAYSSPQLNTDGNYLFRRVATSSICHDTSNTIQVTVYPSISNNSIGGALQYACYNMSKDLAGSFPAGGNNAYSYKWQSSGNGSIWNDITGDGQSLTTPGLLSPTYFRRIVNSGNYNQCADISSSVLLNINPLPAGDIISAEDTICEGNEITVNYQNLTGAAPWVIVLGDNSGTVYTSDALSSSSGNLTFALNQSIDLKVVKITDDSTCAADLISNTGLFKATVYTMPIALVGTDFDACGLSTPLNAQTPGVGIGEWLPSTGTYNNSSLPNATVTVDAYGSYDFTWKVSNWTECTDEDVVTVTFYEQPVDINAGEDISTINYDTTLNANSTTVGVGYWQKASDGKESVFEDSTLSNTNVQLLSGEGEYRFIWLIGNGTCNVISDTVKVTVEEVKTYIGFSPDGNNINDKFIIDIPKGVNATLTIYNRNGIEINTDYCEGDGKLVWDGTNKETGEQVPQDTYYYIYERSDKSKPGKGYIELRRMNR